MKKSMNYKHVKCAIFCKVHGNYNAARCLKTRFPAASDKIISTSDGANIQWDHFILIKLIGFDIMIFSLVIYTCCFHQQHHFCFVKYFPIWIICCYANRHFHDSIKRTQSLICSWFCWVSEIKFSWYLKSIERKENQTNCLNFETKSSDR